MSAKQTAPVVHVEVETTAVSDEVKCRIFDTLNAIRLNTPSRPNREAVAWMFRAVGLGAYIGGCHVAVHVSALPGNPQSVWGSRVAIVTANYGDWV